MAPPPSDSNTLAEIRERKLQRRLANLRNSAERLIVCCPGGSLWLFGSLARGDWDADSDVDMLAVGQLTEAKGFHSQACYHYSQAAEKALKGALKELHIKALSRMSSETRYPQDDEAPVDRFDAKDSAQAGTIAGGILMFVKSILNPEDNV